MSKYLNGIDVSYHQGNINWNKVANNISFAIIRAGYGQNHVDTKFQYNSSECERLNIPYGVYWFSYAKNINDAIKESEICLRTISGKKLSYPVIFDFEYASEQNSNLSNTDRYTIAKTFLDKIEEAGYYAMLYSNVDYLEHKGFNPLTERYDLWLAHWNDDLEPSRKCGIWQWTDRGKVDGITGNVDLDRSIKDYPSIINKSHETVIEKIKKLHAEIGE